MSEKMNPRVKRMWLRALRSGRYAQGRGSLCKMPDSRDRDYRFCCLGVLCDLAVKDGVEVEWSPDPSAPAKRLMIEGDGGGLQEKVREWAGIDTRLAHLEEGDCLAIRNDKGASFQQIADLIEREL